MEYVLYILLGILGFFLLLLGIAILRTLLVKDIPYVKPKTKSSQKTMNAYGKSFAEMIKVKTISDPSGANSGKFAELQDVMAKLFPSLEKIVIKQKFEGGSFLYKWEGKNADKAPILFMAHQDVVPAPSEGWKYDPFSGVIAEGEIWGRGTFDTKCTLFAFFQAAEELIKEGFVPETDIYLAGSCDEEIFGTGAEKTVNWLKDHGIRPFLVIDEGGAIIEDALPTVKRPMALLGVLEKGYVDVKIVAKSHGGHSSTPPKNTPLVRLSRFIVDIDRHFPMKTKMIKEVKDMFETASKSMGFGFRLLFGNLWLFQPLVTWLLPKINSYGRALFSTTVAFTMIKGSDAANVIPSEASLIVNMRPHPIQGADSSINVLKKIAKKYDLEVNELISRDFTPPVSTSSEAYHFVVKAIQANYPDVLISPYVILGGTDCRHYTEVTDAAIRFSPIRVNNADLKKMHGINESLKLETLPEAVNFYKYLMKEYK